MNMPETTMTPRELLTRCIAAMFEGQRVKHTGDPYFTHLTAVAEMAGPATPMGYEIGLCHDLLEDTPTTEAELFEALKEFNYDAKTARYITAQVVALTDVFTSAAYPGLSKDARKEKEAARLLTISPAAQTVKYCDLIDNIKWVLKYKKKPAKYLKRKKILVAGMNSGDKALRQKALDIIEQGLQWITV